MKIKKGLARSLFILYLLSLIWILLFKLAFTAEDFDRLFNSRLRSINLIPFGESLIINGQIDISEIMNNVIIFMPFGGLLGIVNKKAKWIQRIGYIFAFSLGIEVMQYVLGVGASDLTDLITNVSGGIIGLVIYNLLKKGFNENKLDHVLTVIGSILFSLIGLFLLFIIFITV